MFIPLDNADSPLLDTLMPLHFRPTSLFTHRFHILPEPDAPKPLAEVWIGSVRRRGTVTLGDVEIELGIRGLLKPGFTFSHGERTMATGGTLSLWRSKLWLESRDRRYEIRGRHFCQTFDVSENGTSVGTIGRNGMFTRKGTIDLPDSIPVHDRLFMFALAAFSWQQQTAAAAS